MVGITKLDNGLTLEDARRPRVKLPMEATAARIPATSPP